jgi:Tol biopolymer transport system component
LGDPCCILGLVVAAIVVGLRGREAGRARRPDGRPLGVASARDGRASSDSRHLAFQSGEDHPSIGDVNGRLDVFVKDLRTGALVLVSTDSDGNPGDGDSTEPSISADGRRVAFRSAARNLVAGDTNDATDIFVKDLATGATTRVSTNEAGEQADAPSGRPSISADGRYVTFLSSARNLVAEDAARGHGAFLKDLATGRITRVDPIGRVRARP